MVLGEPGSTTLSDSGEGRRLRVHHPGRLGNLLLERFTPGAPGPGEVRIRCARVGVNFADLFVSWGLYKAAPPPPVCPGFEVAGTVEACGPGAERFRPGDKVMALTRFGGYATHVTAAEEVVFPLPPAWSAAEGAAFLVNALTAYHGLYVLGALAPGERVAVTSAAGGVGLVAVKLAVARGARVVGLVGSAPKESLVRAAGAAEVLVYEEPGFRAGLRACLGGEGVDLFFDAVGGRVSAAGFESLRPMGRLVCYGFASMAPRGAGVNWLRLAGQFLFERFKVSPLDMVSENRTVAGYNLVFLWEMRRRAAEYVAALLAIDAQSSLRPLVGREFPFEEAAEAHRFLQSRQSVGKVLLSTE